MTPPRNNPSEPLRLHIADHLPEGFLAAHACDLHSILPGPSLIHLPGRRPEPLFVSILQHGNEDVGLLAMQQLLTAYAGEELPRALSIFVGNVAAARENLRRLDSQPDYNRVWTPEGQSLPDQATPEHRLMRQVIEEMRPLRPFAGIDLHNNTGHNPYYACVTEMRHADLHLASLFGRTVVFFRVPQGVQTMAFAKLCPSVTCECGRVGDEGGVQHAHKFVDACLRLTEIPAVPVPRGDIHLFHTVVTIKLQPTGSISFDGSAADLLLREDFDWFNFRELTAGTPLAKLGGQPGASGKIDWRSVLDVVDDQGRHVAGDFLRQAGSELVLTKSVMPSMFTRDERVIRQDCLGYFMERLELPE